jgi:hypothetical protein
VLRLWQAAYAAIFSIHALELAFRPPARFPDLFVVLNLTLSAAIFGLAYLWSLTRLVEEAWAMAGLASQPPARSAPSTLPRRLSPANSIDRQPSPARSPRQYMDRMPSDSFRQASFLGKDSDAESVGSSASRARRRRPVPSR